MKLAVPLVFIVYLTYFQNAAVSFECFWKSKDKNKVVVMKNV